MRASRWVLPLVLAAIALGAAAWLFTSVGEMHDRLAKHSNSLALAFLVGAGLLAAISAIAGARFFWNLGRPERAGPQAPEDIVRAAELQAEKAEGVIATVRDNQAKKELGDELAALRADHQRRTFHVVVFGTGSAGKTSLINALLGQHVGKTEAVMGTTQQGEDFTHRIEGVEGTVFLTDTPGLSEIGAGGAARE